jgi:hypothetical protein
MKEIIGQISRIDAVAFENEQKNKSILENEKQRYENEIKSYRDQKLSEANAKAKMIYQQIVGDAKNVYQIREKKIKEISSQINSNYLKVEKDVIKKVFEKLFIE